MRRVIISTVILLLAAIEVRAQAAADSPEQKLAEEWLKRLNALDDWYLSADGKEEGIEPLVNSMMELYAPDVLAEVPPHDKDQIGPVVLRGSGQLRKYFEKIARTQVRLDYIIPRQTTKEFEGLELVYSKQLPWGGLGISFPIIAVYSTREDRRRFMSPGMVVLQTGDDKKIHRFRLYLTELAEVMPM